MNDDREQLPDPPKGGTPNRELRQDLVEAAKERLRISGGQVRQMACMQLPPALFNDLCVKILERNGLSVREITDWLSGQTADAPTKSSVDRFAAALKNAYKLAQLSDNSHRAEEYVAAYTEGDPNARVMALNARFTELVTEALMDADSLGQDADMIFALTGAAKAVAQVTFGKQSLDSQIAGRNKLIEQREASIRLLEQRLLEQTTAYKKQTAEAVKAAETVAKDGGGPEAIIKAVREVLG